MVDKVVQKMWCLGCSGFQDFEIYVTDGGATKARCTACLKSCLLSEVHIMYCPGCGRDEHFKIYTDPTSERNMARCQICHGIRPLSSGKCTDFPDIQNVLERISGDFWFESPEYRRMIESTIHSLASRIFLSFSHFPPLVDVGALSEKEKKSLSPPYSDVASLPSLKGSGTVVAPVLRDDGIFLTHPYTGDYVRVQSLEEAWGVLEADDLWTKSASQAFFVWRGGEGGEYEWDLEIDQSALSDLSYFTYTRSALNAAVREIFEQFGRLIVQRDSTRRRLSVWFESRDRYQSWTELNPSYYIDHRGINEIVRVRFGEKLLSTMELLPDPESAVVPESVLD